MKYENYRLPGGKTLSEATFEDIRWQYGVFRCNSTGAGRDKKYTPWRAVKTKLGEIEECDWCKLVEAVIGFSGDTSTVDTAAVTITYSELSNIQVGDTFRFPDGGK